MAITRGRLAIPMQLAASGGTPTTIYTVPSATTTFVSGFTLHNTNSSEEVVVLTWDPTSGSSQDFLRVSLAPLETLIVEFPSDGLVLQVGDAITGSSTVANRVVVIMHGLRDV